VVGYFINLVFSSLLISCGLSRGLSERFDPPPGGTVLYQAAFNPNSNSITGTAQVYDTAGLIVLRLTGFSSPSTAYFVFLETASNNQVYVAPLASQIGSINYNTGLSVGPVFTRAAIKQNANAFSLELAAATF